MAEFDPQGEEKNQAGQCESDSCCGGSRARRDENDSFVADWSGAEKKLEAQASAFEATHTEPRTPETFWVELVQSQLSPQSAGLEATSAERAAGVQSEQFWADLVRSQKPAGQSGEFWADLVRSQQPGGQSPQFWQDLVRSQQTGAESSASPVISSLSYPPTGMGWSDGEASEWSPPEERQYEPVEAAGEPLEIEASARREDVAWTVPASSEQDWASARSEGLHFEPSAEGTSSLMAAAVEAAQRQAKAKKTVAKKTVAKKPAAKKTVVKKAVKAKKPAAKKVAAKKVVKAKKVVAKKLVKKVVKKATNPLKITKAPTRRAA